MRDSPSICAVQTIYSTAMIEELKMFQVVDKLVELVQAGTSVQRERHAAPLGE